MRTYIYVDGFNFYYGAIKDTPYKWLDFKKLFQNLLDPSHNIISIKYFTAEVTGKIDPNQPIRQQTYLRALRKHIPEISIFLSHFTSHNVYRFLAHPPDDRLFGKKIKFARIVNTEEKGSDVNLAVHLLNDAWLDLYDCAVIVSNDLDIVEAMKLVKTHHTKKIGLLTPWRYNPLKKLQAQADFGKKIRQGVMGVSQLPDPIPGTKIHKPRTW